MSSGFTHLHLHTQFSLLDGFCELGKLAAKAKELGQTSLAITDHGVMFGCIDFYKKCKAEGIKPIIGCEVYMAERTRHDKDSAYDRNNYHLVLLAENNEGYQNLIKLVSIANSEGFYYKPRIDWELLEKYNKGIIALSGCISGKIPHKVIVDDIDGARADLEHFVKIFGKNNFFLEIQDHSLEEEKKANEALIKFAEEYGLGLVATNDAHYIEKTDAQYHDILLCIQTTATFNDEKRMRFPNDEFYLKSEEEMRALFSYIPSAIENTEIIAQRCNVDFEFHHYHLPQYQLPENVTSEAYLRDLCKKGLYEKYDEKQAEDLVERLNYELDVIKNMGFCDYFLIVWDFIKYSKDHDIPVGPGRGSAAGSLVSYCLNITEIDPIKYSLIFERFLNSERVSMPDIDVDFCYEKRQKVIEYVKEKYGVNNVSQIVTFGTLKAKAAVRDVGRTIGMSYAECDRVAKEISDRPKTTIDSAIAENPELARMIESDPTVKRLIELSKAVEGCPRNMSTHAAGVVITDKPVMEYVPLSQSKDGGMATQYTMTTVEELGLLKMDFLGLRNLTVIKDTVDNVKKSCGIELDIDHLEFNDPNVYALITKGDTSGVFQLESSGMRSFMQNLKPDTFEDIIAGISLYRPGPMDFIPEYIRNKKDPSSIHYIHTSLEPILGVTYGCMVYQEQVMQIVRDLAGFSMGQSDNVRRAMSKKKHDVMKAQREIFVNGDEQNGIIGCVANGIDADSANKIYDQMESFAAYAFNKSHAAAYAVVAYRTAFLKAYYPTEFLAALMTSVMGFDDKLKGYVKELNDHNITLLSPDVNDSYARFTVSDGNIRYGLLAVKSLGGNAVDEIIRIREEKGKFTDFADFVEKMEFSSLNKRGVENLIKSGAFDSLGYKRSELLYVYSDYIDGITKEKKQSIDGQISLIDLMTDQKEATHLAIPKNMQELSYNEMLDFEREALGMYISGHPLDSYSDVLSSIVTHDSVNLSPSITTDEEDENDNEDSEKQEDDELKDGETVVVAGMIISIKTVMTKSDKVMAFIQLEDKYGRFESVIFPKTYEQNVALIKKDKKIIIKGRITKKSEGDISVAASHIYDLDNPSSYASLKNHKGEAKHFSKITDTVKKAPEKNREYKKQPQSVASKTIVKDDSKNEHRLESIPQNACVVISFSSYDSEKLPRIKQLLEGKNGKVKVILYNKENRNRYVTDKTMWLDENVEGLLPIRNVIGYENVKIIAD